MILIEKIFSQLENSFYDYTNKYDENIKKIIKEREIEISTAELEEILQDAKNIL